MPGRGSSLDKNDFQLLERLNRNIEELNKQLEELNSKGEYTLLDFAGDVDPEELKRVVEIQRDGIQEAQNEEEFTELFEATYTGSVGRLMNSVQDIIGVESVSYNKRQYVSTQETIDLEITYNSHMTDRTRLASDIESIDGVEDVVFG